MREIIIEIKQRLKADREDIEAEIGVFEVTEEDGDSVIIETETLEYRVAISPMTGKLIIKEIGYEGIF